jgi:hypothetical protein
MDTSMAALWDLVRETVTDPRGAARRIIAARVPMRARWLALALVVVLSVLLGQITLRLLLAPSGMMGAVLSGPASSILLQAGVLILMAIAAHQVGRWMGGYGTFPDAMLLIACLQGVMVLVQAVQIVALLLLPPLAGIVSLLGFVAFLWILTGFVAELHGFRSMLAVLGMVVVTAFGVAFLLALVLAIFGITPPATA